MEKVKKKKKPEKKEPAKVKNKKKPLDLKKARKMIKKLVGEAHEAGRLTLPDTEEKMPKAFSPGAFDREVANSIRNIVIDPPKKKKNDTYTFLIKDRKVLDFHRIARETRADDKNAAGFLVLGPKSNAAICLYQEFLDKFEGGDGIRVAHHPLCSEWGSYHVPDLTADTHKFKADEETLHGCVAQGFRTKVIRKDAIGDVLKQIDVAKKRSRKKVMRKMRITVKTF